MSLSNTKRVASIIADAGGRLVGRTRLQKICYLLSVVGLEDGFSFRYAHYGPFSEELAEATHLGQLLGELQETKEVASWGGSYSIFQAQRPADTEADALRAQFASIAANCDAVELELAATAVFLAIDGYQDPWVETARRKPEKADEGRLNGARELLRKLSDVATPQSLPDFV